MLIRCAVVAAAVVVASSAQGALLAHELTHTIQQTRAGETLNPIGPMTFLAAAEEFDFTSHTLADGAVVTNPLYEGRTTTATNPLFEGVLRDGGDLSGDDGIVAEFDWRQLSWSVNGDGTIHRELEARGVFLHTSLGTYSNAVGDAWLFESDGPLRADLNSIRWMAPESIRLYLGGDVTASDYVDIQALAVFDAVVVPAPSSALPLAMGAVALRRRR